MPQPAHLDPSAYAADRGPVGLVLLHGFTGSVAETRPMGEYLADRGFSVRCPLLPGHGTRPEDLHRVRWQAWAAEAERASQSLRPHCRTVFAGGLSLGALLALWLGLQHRDVAGLLLMGPALVFRSRLALLTPLLRRFFRFSPFGPMGDDDLGDPQAIERIWCYDELPLWGAGETVRLQQLVRRALPRIRQPVLIFQGRRDAALRPEGAQALHDGVSSTDKTLIWLENSGHNVLADGERETIWARSSAWMHERAGPG